MTSLELPTLRPLSIGQLLDRAFRLYRKNIAVFMGIVAITQIPLAIATILINIATLQSPAGLGPDGLPTAGTITGFFALFAIFLLTAFFTQIGTAALTRAIADDYLSKPVTLGGTFRRIKSDWLRLIGTGILFGLVLIGLMIPFFLVALIPCLGAIIAFIGVFGLVIVAGIISYLLPCVVILEKDGGRTALRRAWRLVSLRFWWVLGYIIVLGLLNWLIVSGPAALVAAGIELAGLNLVTTTISEQVTRLVLSAIFTPLQLTAVTLMYFDLRIRFEGFDLMVLAAGDKPGDANLDDVMKEV